jgi:hypothetical protein
VSRERAVAHGDKEVDVQPSISATGNIGTPMETIMIRTKSVGSSIDHKNDGLRILVTRIRGRGS